MGGNRAELTRPWPRRVVEHWVARRDGEAVGALSLAMPTHDNVGSALVDGDVLPAHRRRASAGHCSRAPPSAPARTTGPG
ncbi:hypothetical protein ACFQV8_11915 [Pseudonocardia benzenivorans]